jgi:hypothetical protein
MPEKLPVPSLESIQLLTQDVGSVFQGKMNSVVVALRNALIAFNAQIDAAETASQQVEPAPEAIALEGANNTYKMTPLRSAQLIEKLLTDATADEAEALAGTSDKLITALLLDLVLEWRLGTAGNLGNAAQRNVMTSLNDTTTPDALMPRGAFGLGVATAAENWNTAEAVSKFRSGATGSPLGATNVIGFRSAIGADNYVDYAARDNRFFGRTMHNGAQQPWQEFFTKRNILGAVSFAAGVPAGSVFDTATIGGGGYQRTADGFVWQSIVFSVPSGVWELTNWGPGQQIYTVAIPLNYHAAIVSGSFFAGALLCDYPCVAAGVVINSIGTTGCTIRLIAAYPANIQGTLNFKGRWA